MKSPGQFYAAISHDLEKAKRLLASGAAPPELMKALDMNTIKKIEGPFVNPQKDEKKPDFAFAIWPKKGMPLGCDFVVFLLEYVMEQDPDLIKKIYVSSASIREHFANQGDDVRAVPAIVYNGPEEWNLPQRDFPEGYFKQKAMEG